MKAFRVLVLMVTVSMVWAGLTADAGAKGNDPTVYVMTFTGFQADEAEAVIAVMRDEFPGFAGLRPRQETASDLIYGYATTVEPGKLRGWITILLNDLGHVPGRDVVVRFGDGRITLEKTAGQAASGPLSVRVVFLPRAARMDVGAGNASLMAFRDGLAKALKQRSATVLDAATVFGGKPPANPVAAIAALKAQGERKADVVVVYRVRARMQPGGEKAGRLAAVGYLSVWDLRRGAKSERDALAGRVLPPKCGKGCINQALTASTRDLAADLSPWLIHEVGK
jgi:hypothetical protein